ncbi:hypothetical protein Y032_0026g1374 [Ancylostoma ceylanicum]|uniref:Uncharacterized protein n=1 Tax=Ancylostoma ceylanicum TaxID=53326 RepID=A0A016UWE2_9BILA|nr:hypothetical protein Y032_0026g1374 [Ancylostoma ceylanicum]
MNSALAFLIFLAVIFCVNAQYYSYPYYYGGYYGGYYPYYGKDMQLKRSKSEFNSFYKRRKPDLPPYYLTSLQFANNGQLVLTVPELEGFKMMKSALVFVLLLALIFCVNAQWGSYYSSPYYGGYGYSYYPSSSFWNSGWGTAAKGALAGAVIGGLLG